MCFTAMLKVSKFFGIMYRAVFWFVCLFVWIIDWHSSVRTHYNLSDNKAHNQDEYITTMYIST